MGTRRVDPREQFSKWLAKWTALFWFCYMLIMAVALVIQPQIADAAVYIVICTSLVMLLNVWAYTKNSIYEKAILAGLEKDRLKLTWKNGGTEKDDEHSDEEVG